MPLQAEAAAIDDLKASWDGMEKAEGALRSELLDRLKRLDGAALEWERLQRGVKQVRGWLDGAREAIESSEAPQTEEARKETLRSQTGRHTATRGVCRVTQPP